MKRWLLVAVGLVFLFFLAKMTFDMIREAN